MASRKGMNDSWARTCRARSQATPQWNLIINQASHFICPNTSHTPILYFSPAPVSSLSVAQTSRPPTVGWHPAQPVRLVLTPGGSSPPVAVCPPYRGPRKLPISSLPCSPFPVSVSLFRSQAPVQQLHPSSFLPFGSKYMWEGENKI